MKSKTTPPLFKALGSSLAFPLAFPLLLALSACGGGGGASVCADGTNNCTTPTPTPAAYVGDDVGDYTYKYTAVRTGEFLIDGTPISNHYGYREPTCKYLDADREDFLNHGGRNVVLAKYLGTSLNPARQGDAAFGVYPYRETYDFKAIDKTHMTFTHKISIYADNSTFCQEVLFGKQGEITRTGEDTTLPTLTINPHIFSDSGNPGGFWWSYFLVQRTGKSLFTWTGKATLPTGEEVDMFDVDLPELTNRAWNFQAWSTDTLSGTGLDLSHSIFNGKKAKALVYMQRNTNDKTNPWGYTSIKMIMDPTNYMTTTPLSQWQSFEGFQPKFETQNLYDLPTQ